MQEFYVRTRYKAHKKTRSNIRRFIVLAGNHRIVPAAIKDHLTTLCATNDEPLGNYSIECCVPVSTKPGVYEID